MNPAKKTGTGSICCFPSLALPPSRWKKDLIKFMHLSSINKD